MKEKSQVLDSILGWTVFISFVITSICMFAAMFTGSYPFIQALLGGICISSFVVFLASFIANCILNKKDRSKEKTETLSEQLYRENIDKASAATGKDSAEYDLAVYNFNAEMATVKADLKEKISTQIKAHPEQLEVSCFTIPITEGIIKLYGYENRQNVTLDAANTITKYLTKELGFRKYTKDYDTNIEVKYDHCETVIDPIFPDTYKDIYKVVIYNWQPEK